MIDEATYADYRARIDAEMAWIDTIRDKRSGWASYRPEDMPDAVLLCGHILCHLHGFFFGQVAAHVGFTYDPM